MITHSPSSYKKGGLCIGGHDLWWHCGALDMHTNISGVVRLFM